jgi:hypothetical protein
VAALVAAHAEVGAEVVGGAGAGAGLVDLVASAAGAVSVEEVPAVTGDQWSVAWRR